MKLKDYRYDIEMCVRCSSCKWIDPIWSKSKRRNKICPISSRYFFDAYSCQGIMDMSLAYLDKEIGYSKELLDVLYKCTLCGACDVMCKRCIDNERLEVIEAFRADAVEKKKAPLPVHKKIIKNVCDKHNPYGNPHEKRSNWLQGKQPFSEKPEIVYFAGCTSSYLHPEIVLSTIKILNAASVNFTIMGPDEWCCGNPLIRIGDTKQAKKIMAHNMKVLEKSGAKKVLTSCAECYHVWKVDYQRLREKEKMEYEVFHTSEYVNQLIELGKLNLTKPVKLNASYHDSCRLARLSEPYILWKGERVSFGRTEPVKKWRRGTNGVYEPPRNVLKKIPGLNLVEMERIRENAWCCGAGGGVKWAFNDFATWTATERLDEASSVGADAIIAGCPFCKWNFKDTAKKTKSKIKVYDFVEVVAEAI
ncbi:MAG: hypothetical protein A3C43_00050 [Candidatus Schekmanbacteria bacterium RIFCSPHIGHO2_02_FULL_38_11]|uniref:Cysteine-rich domain-containing protein n=1 Tax=Candidatus Schekmanbacteria bacterium RIFCSPLOWO2_12_FULL_38_15 TaxID=1817883 RepID=A0A1F7SEC6_9BACT|nr:MAG: hypothetical protein A2043_07390 [Candidatus Schekmanbacteria bacterium GWA2_38_9]OGL49144.1 MAG: hypothetical protein A3H37_04205 [Candidatus Schekmanbacteria bacterium RIFCSPLOWO2_02_FULL_38_14]OGL52120.1 MAG: hypothetical protein A3G31_06790 [Candidatus Schekmanbacteria bacterium RIFCSPLOWO2_12_FULL_38_15]OGL55577.1 MAG: hypothetical protein A3C43_00050 [Candidatus Schekmanbacteria bacterium RIFCSPHIGHO2_02_FULL_38_11]